MSDDPVSDDLEFETRLARRQKRKLIIGVCIGVVVVLGVVVGYVLWPSAPEPKCKESDVRAFLKNREIPAVALHRVCELPTGLAKALRESLGSPPQYRKLILLKAIAENRSLITGVCPNAMKAISAAAQERPEKHASLYLARCDLSKMGIASKSDLAGSSLEGLILATALYAALKDSDPKWAKALAREACCSGRK